MTAARKSLFRLPTELVCEVMETLSACDLIRLAQTCKLAKKMVIDRSSVLGASTLAREYKRLHEQHHIPDLKGLSIEQALRAWIGRHGIPCRMGVWPFSISIAKEYQKANGSRREQQQASEISYLSKVFEFMLWLDAATTFTVTQIKHQIYDCILYYSVSLDPWIQRAAFKAYINEYDTENFSRDLFEHRISPQILALSDWRSAVVGIRARPLTTRNPPLDEKLRRLETILPALPENDIQAIKLFSSLCRSKFQLPNPRPLEYYLPKHPSDEKSKMVCVGFKVFLEQSSQADGGACAFDLKLLRASVWEQLDMALTINCSNFPYSTERRQDCDCANIRADSFAIAQ